MNPEASPTRPSLRRAMRLPFVLAFRQTYTPEPILGAAGLDSATLSKQQVAWLMQRATQMQQWGWSEHSSPLSGSLKLSQPI